MFARELLPGICAIRNSHTHWCGHARPDLLRRLDEAEAAVAADDPGLAVTIIDRLYGPYTHLVMELQQEVLPIIICLCNGRPEEIAA